MTPTLNDLKPLHLPPEVGIWPPAPGWWLVILTAAAFSLAAGWTLVRCRRLRAYRRQALRVLERCFRDARAREDSAALADYLQACSAVIRGAALRAYPREWVAPLTGERWQGFLRLTARDPAQAELLVRVLAEQAYRPCPTGDLTALHRAACHWIRQHPPLNRRLAAALAENAGRPLNEGGSC